MVYLALGVVLGGPNITANLLREAAKKKILVAPRIFRGFFSELQKNSFFLGARPLPPPLLVDGPLKKQLLFFATSLSHDQYLKFILKIKEI